MDIYSLEIDPDQRLVPTARMFAATVARQLGAPEDSVLDLKIAISEACTNAVQAHQEHGVTAPVRVRVEEEPGTLSYEIEDEGGGIDEVVPASPPEVFRKAAEDEESGLGLALIRALFPAAEFEARAQGTLVRFRLSR